METLRIEKTTDTPFVNFDPALSHFELSGRSYPEDTLEFYAPILEWMNAYAKAPEQKTNFFFRLQYFNSSSYKPIFDLLNILQTIKSCGKSVSVEWHYKAGDSDMHEAGEEFSDLADIPFSFFTY